MRNVSYRPGYSKDQTNTSRELVKCPGLSGIERTQDEYEEAGRMGGSARAADDEMEIELWTNAWRDVEIGEEQSTRDVEVDRVCAALDGLEIAGRIVNDDRSIAG